jgi:hypothetical protein
MIKPNKIQSIREAKGMRLSERDSQKERRRERTGATPPRKYSMLCLIITPMSLWGKIERWGSTAGASAKRWSERRRGSTHKSMLEWRRPQRPTDAKPPKNDQKGNGKGKTAKHRRIKEPTHNNRF